MKSCSALSLLKVSLLVPFSQQDLLAYYHCAEFFRSTRQEDKQPLDCEGLLAYMDSVKSWAHKAYHSDEASFLGGDDEESSVALYSSSLGILVSAFSVRAVSGITEAIFFTRRIPEKVRDNHLLVACVAIQALRDIGLSSRRVWLTTGENHLPIEPPEVNFEIVNRISLMMQEGQYQVKTGRKCTFCPIKDTCTVYSEVERVLSMCAQGPAFFPL